MKANFNQAKQGAFDLLNAINELKTLLPKVRDETEELKTKVADLEKRLADVERR